MLQRKQLYLVLCILFVSTISSGMQNNQPRVEHPSLINQVATNTARQLPHLLVPVLMGAPVPDFNPEPPTFFQGMAIGFVGVFIRRLVNDPIAQGIVRDIVNNIIMR